MIRIGICDDESYARDELRIMLEKILRNDDEKIIYEFSTGEGIVKWAAQHRGELDMLFLDVEMKGISGLEAARLIRAQDSEILIVFVTGYRDFVFEGYAVQAMDYLVKPANAEKLKALLQRVREQLEKQTPQTFTVQNTDGLYRIFKKDILYLYSDRRLVKLVIDGKEYPFYGKLDEVGERLGEGFVRIHQRYLVNANAVQAVEGNSVLVGAAHLPVSRALQREAMLSLARAMLGGGAE